MFLLYLGLNNEEKRVLEEFCGIAFSDTNPPCLAPTPSMPYLFISAFALTFQLSWDDAKPCCITDTPAIRLWSYLERQLNVEPRVLQEFDATIRRDIKGPSPYTACYTPPAPSPIV